MQVQFKQDIQKIEAGETGEFDLLKSNGAFRNPMAIIYPLVEAASYEITVTFDGVNYPALDVTRTAERSLDMLVLTPQNRYFPPNIGTGLPGDFSERNPLHEIPIIVNIENTGGAARVFYVSVTWEVNPPGAGGGSN
jgi:hypothetical protein